MKKLLEQLELCEDWKTNLAAGLVAGAALLSPVQADAGVTHQATHSVASKDSNIHKNHSAGPNLSDTGSTLGVKDNNPVNLRDAGIDWNGRIGHDSKGFVKFDTLVNGFRAAIKNFKTNQAKKNITVDTYIRHFANTSSKDEQDSYIKFVYNKLGVSPTTLIKDIDAFKFVEYQAEFESKIKFTDQLKNDVRKRL